jgi:hypothetical protein
MADPKQRALKEAQRSQAKYEKAQERLDQEGQTRRESFKRAKDAGATLREIGAAVGLHWSRIREIVSGR